VSAKPNRKRIYIPTGRPRGRPPKPHVAPPTSTLAAAIDKPSAVPLLVLRTDDAARAVRISKSHMKRLIASGAIPSVKRGRLRLIMLEALRAWVEGGS
jgi:excisionase family DNA binding protein